VVYEALNIASLWGAPVFYVVEDNCIAQTTPTEAGVAGSLPGRFQAFGIPVDELGTSDVLEILPVAGKLIAEVRSEGSPRALILHTNRFGPHSKGDDTRHPEEVERLRQERDPLTIHGSRLEAGKRLEIEAELEQEISQAFQSALNDPFPTLSKEPGV
jgi:TPP-dependent pyruvate/acetoin dehydrogenase alpha subunit